MAAIVPIPPVHLTHRAKEWLTRSATVIGSLYHAPAGVAACWSLDDVGGATLGTTLAVPADWSCGVADVRALWLSTLPRHDHSAEPYKVVSVTPRGLNNGQKRIATGATYAYHRAAILTPTCMECKVQLDRAMERAIDKHGAYRDVTTSGKVQWKHWPPRPDATDHWPDHWPDDGPA